MDVTAPDADVADRAGAPTDRMRHRSRHPARQPEGQKQVEHRGLVGRAAAIPGTEHVHRFASRQFATADEVPRGARPRRPPGPAWPPRPSCPADACAPVPRSLHRLSGAVRARSSPCRARAERDRQATARPPRRDLIESRGAANVRPLRSFPRRFGCAPRVAIAFRASDSGSAAAAASAEALGVRTERRRTRRTPGSRRTHRRLHPATSLLHESRVIPTRTGRVAICHTDCIGQGPIGEEARQERAVKAGRRP
jgi:hypothetical protein